MMATMSLFRRLPRASNGFSATLSGFGRSSLCFRGNTGLAAWHLSHVRPVSTSVHEYGNFDIALTRSGLSVKIKHDAEHRRRELFPYLWLRDNCRCSSCINQDTQQRQLNTFEIPQDVHAKDVEVLHEGVDGREPGIYLTWNDNHKSFYPFPFVNQYTKYDNNMKGEQSSKVTWDSQGVDRKLNTIPFTDVMQGDSGLASLLSMIHTYGYAIVTQTPHDTPSPTQHLLERIAFIRVTHYGGFYDFIPDLAMADTAYTNLALPAHTDTTYFTDPAGLQAFHLLSHQPAPDTTTNDTSQKDSMGGETILVDGLRAADLIRETDAKAYDVLSNHRLPWHASGNEGIAITPDTLHPVIENDSATGELVRVRWNNDDRGVVPWDGGRGPEEWYAAARVWHSVISSSGSQFQLRPGEVLSMVFFRYSFSLIAYLTSYSLVFDNYRVLHGRTAFTGIRRICGGYIARDDYISRWRTLTQDPSSVRLRTIGC
ncbi:hypothetical protein QBC47DRAFT_368488 [Echria macrotheca]|uniref:Trimethyllysine dioxygenase n=1 Tax=Echria macrotheca TaxID=438768 RepID=A0AAJ0FF16_9PEZI|nr:hypothetical protein QBC47DRAFT_368488 [Echria macrotheca]